MPPEARRNPLTGGPAVPAPRYLASIQWQRMKSLRARAAAAAGAAAGGGPASGLGGAGAGGRGGRRAKGRTEKPAVVVVNALGSIVQSAPGGGPVGGGERFVESVKLVKALAQLRQMDHVGGGAFGGGWGFQRHSRRGGARGRGGVLPAFPHARPPPRPHPYPTPKKVKAVVLRINSPGGSATASDGGRRAWQANGRARQRARGQPAGLAPRIPLPSKPDCPPPPPPQPSHPPRAQAAGGGGQAGHRVDGRRRGEVRAAGRPRGAP
jgi:hypothetical protein